MASNPPSLQDADASIISTVLAAEWSRNEIVGRALNSYRVEPLGASAIPLSWVTGTFGSGCPPRLLGDLAFAAHHFVMYSQQTEQLTAD